jgi:hypothetical protein
MSSKIKPYQGVSFISSVDGNGYPNTKAYIYFYDKRFFRGVMLKGKMEAVDDKKLNRKFGKMISMKTFMILNLGLGKDRVDWFWSCFSYPR